MHTQLILSKIDGLTAVITLPDGNKIYQPMYGDAHRTIEKHYDLEITESHETYWVVKPVLKAAEPEKEESK